MQTGMIFDILRCSTDDGPGIRTTVFFKGCPLRCLWCHNPESQSVHPQLSFDFEKCVSCGRCAAVCACHEIRDGRHTVNREQCKACGKCVSVCPVHALEIKGRTTTADEVMAVVRKDVSYYSKSGGGVTFSGGEPCMKPDFLLALLKACKDESIHTAVETSGCISGEVYKAIQPWTDLFLWDYKVTERSEYYIGIDRRRILENLETVLSLGAKVRLRCPIIPGVNDNDTHLRAIAELSRKYPLEGIDILPYHNMGVYKSEKLGRAPWDKEMQNLSAESKQRIGDMLAREGCRNFRIA